MGCRGGRDPLEIDASTGRAGEFHALEFQHFRGLGHQLVEVERPLHGRRFHGAEGGHLHGGRGDPRLLDPQPITPGRPPPAPQPCGEGLVPPQQPFLSLAGVACDGGFRRTLLRRDDALHGGEIPRTAADLQHALVAIGSRDGRDLQLPARHPHIGPHGETARHGPRGRCQIDIRGHRKILPDERLGPVPRAARGQPDPARRFGLEQLRNHLQRAHGEPVAVDRQIDRHLAPIERDQFGQRVRLADGQLRSRYNPGDADGLDRGPRTLPPRQTGIVSTSGATRGRQRDVQSHVRQSVEHVIRVEPCGHHARHPQRQPGGSHRECPLLFGGLAVGRRHRPSAVPREDGGGTGRDRRSIESAGGVRARACLGMIVLSHAIGRLAGGRGAGGTLNPVRRDAVGGGMEVPQRRAAVPRSARDRPAGERRIGPYAARRQKIGDPPGIVAFQIDQFDGRIDQLEFERRRNGRRLHHRRQPGGEHILERATASADLHECLAADEPHRAKIGRIDDQARQAAIDHDAGHGHERPPFPVAEHDVAVFDGAPPLPLGGVTGHPAVDAGEDRLQRPVTEIGEHDHRRGEPGGGPEHGQRRQREDGTAATRPRLPLLVRLPLVVGS